MNSICLEDTDLKTIGDSLIAEFEDNIASIPDELCSSFRAAAERLETQLLMLYKVAVMMTKREEDLDRIAATFTAVAQMCDLSLTQLLDLNRKHPHCGAVPYSDRILDLKNKCLRLQRMHS
jgi:hypothetical protein